MHFNLHSTPKQYNTLDQITISISHVKDNGINNLQVASLLVHAALLSGLRPMPYSELTVLVLKMRWYMA